MEFNEKLQELRKSKGLTQEELAEALYVSRTAVSKWESGRGYPNIDSLKEISRFFSVSIDDLLSGEAILSIAEKENKDSIRSVCGFLFSVADLFSFVFVFLPLYPNRVDGFVYSVNLFGYMQTTDFNKAVYWILFGVLFAVGVAGLIFTKKSSSKNKALMNISVAVSIVAVIFLALSRVVYAAVVAFLLLVVKGAILLKNKD